MGRFTEVRKCLNPKCGNTFEYTGTARKFCCYKCGDKLRSKTYRDRFPHLIKATYRKKYRNNKDMLLARQKVWREKNPDKVKASNQRLYLSYSKADRNFNSQKYYERNKDKALSRDARRRGKKAEGFVSKEDWQIIKAYWNNRCAYCQKKLPLAQDHIVALSKGGEHVKNNIAPACKSCNSSKFNRDVIEFLASIGRLGIRQLLLAKSQYSWPNEADTQNETLRTMMGLV